MVGENLTVAAPSEVREECVPQQGRGSWRKSFTPLLVGWRWGWGVGGGAGGERRITGAKEEGNGETMPGRKQLVSSSLIIAGNRD